jgi:hypothetical protein
VRRTGAWSHRCSPTAEEEDEPDEAVPEGCSLEHEQRWRFIAMEMKIGGSLSSARGRRKARGSSGEWGNGAVRAGGAHRFYRGCGSVGEEWTRVVTGAINGFNTIEGRVRLRGVKGGLDGGAS